MPRHQPSTQDMNRWMLELKLYLAKESNRFKIASQLRQFEQVLLDALPRNQSEAEKDIQENTIILDRIRNREDERRLSSFLERLVNRCSSPEDHELMQQTLRSSLLSSRRRSIMASQASEGSEYSSASTAAREPLCFFCSSDLPRSGSTLMDGASRAGNHPVRDADSPGVELNDGASYTHIDQEQAGPGALPTASNPFSESTRRYLVEQLSNAPVITQQHPLSLNYYQPTPSPSVAPPTPTPDIFTPYSTTPPLVMDVPETEEQQQQQQPVSSQAPVSTQTRTVPSTRVVYVTRSLSQHRAVNNGRQEAEPAAASQPTRFNPLNTNASATLNQAAASTSKRLPRTAFTPANLPELRRSSSDSAPSVESHLARSFVASMQVEGEPTVVQQPEEQLTRHRLAEQLLRQQLQAPLDGSVEYPLDDHEDSMQDWFEDLNSKDPDDLPRASTPLSTSIEQQEKEKEKEKAYKIAAVSHTVTDLSGHSEIKMTIKRNGSQKSQEQEPSSSLLNTNSWHTNRSTTPPLIKAPVIKANGSRNSSIIPATATVASSSSSPLLNSTFTSFSQQINTTTAHSLSRVAKDCQFSSQQPTASTSRAPVAKIRTKRTKRRQNSYLDHSTSKQFFKQSAC